jgi:hypothetical protein
MLMMKERLPPFRTVEGWARLILLEAGAIRECEEDGWMRDRSDPPCPRASLPRCQAIANLRHRTILASRGQKCRNWSCALRRWFPAKESSESDMRHGRATSIRHTLVIGS